MTAPGQQHIKTAVPDLTDTRLDELADDGTNVLAHAIATYRARLKANGVPLSSFNARI